RLRAAEARAAKNVRPPAGRRPPRQPPAAIERFWRVILVSALNEELERCSAAYARQIFRTGSLSHRRAYEMGVPAVPLRELYEPCVARIREQGGQVHYRQSARSIQLDESGRVRGVALAGGDAAPADYVISAVPFDAIP